MRLEGMLRSDWLPELESSRQIFKYLANKQILANQPKLALDFQKNLEAVIRLEQMDLPTLRKMKMPKKGAGEGESQAGKKRKKGKKKGKKKGEKQGKGKKPSKSSRKGKFNEYSLPKGS